MEPCDCKEKIVLEKGEGSFVAYESWCPEHGYYTNCCICNPKDGIFHTELCRRKHDLYDKGKIIATLGRGILKEDTE